MRVVEFEIEHMKHFPKTPCLDSMKGLTLLNDAGRPIMCGGELDAMWGSEMWIAVMPGLGVQEAMKVARLARRYVHETLVGKRQIFAHAFAGNERWLRWLGFEFVGDVEGCNVQRWRKGAPQWESKQR